MDEGAENGFDKVFRIIKSGEAEFFASDLFTGSFGAAFPVPASLGEQVSTEDWHQFVALYRWPDGLIETVGFCNWIRYGEVYLGGGLCVKADFYRRMPRAHWQVCRARGGIAQLVMEFAAGCLNDGVAWFSHCGDRQAMIVDQRVGFEKTHFEHLIVKWFKVPGIEEQNRICTEIAKLGPF